MIGIVVCLVIVFAHCVKGQGAIGLGPCSYSIHGKCDKECEDRLNKESIECHERLRKEREEHEKLIEWETNSLVGRAWVTLRNVWRRIFDPTNREMDYREHTLRCMVLFMTFIALVVAISMAGSVEKK